MSKLSPFSIPQVPPATGMYTRAYFRRLPRNEKDRLNLEIRRAVDTARAVNMPRWQIFPTPWEVGKNLPN